jgi:methylglyoxal synthase
MRPYLVILILCLFGSEGHAENDQVNAYRQAVFGYIKRLERAGLTDQHWKALMKFADTDNDPMAIRAAMSDPLIRDDDQAMAIALTYPAKDVQIYAATRLQAVGKETNIPALVAAYESLEREVIIGGAAAYEYHAQMHEELIAALARILGMQIVPNVLSDPATADRVLKAARNEVASMSTHAH